MVIWVNRVGRSGGFIHLFLLFFVTTSLFKVTQIRRGLDGWPQQATRVWLDQSRV